MKHLLLPALLALALAGCEKEAADTSQMAPPAASSATDTTPPPAPSGPAPGSTAGPVDGTAMVSAVAPTDQLGNDVDGFRDLRWNMSVDELRSSWKEPLAPASLPDAQACAFLASGSDHDIGLMVEGGQFKRVDVRKGDTAAPGGGRIGMTANEITTLYKGRIEAQPNKYTPNAKDLIVTPSAEARARIVFQTGADGIVARWHMGVPPQALYVEGCG
jgi:hypothetical protein